MTPGPRTQEPDTDDIKQQHEDPIEQNKAAQTREGQEGLGDSVLNPHHFLPGGPQPLGSALEEVSKKRENYCF